MNMTISIGSGIGCTAYRGHFSLEDINIIYAALLHYNKEFDNRIESGQTKNLISPRKTSERIHKLSEVFRRCGDETSKLDEAV